MAVDLTTIQSLQKQVQALTAELATMQPGPAHDVVTAQIAALNAEMGAAIDNAQQQSNGWANVLNGLGLLSMLNAGGGVLGSGGLTSVINIFKGK